MEQEKPAVVHERIYKAHSTIQPQAWTRMYIKQECGQVPKSSLVWPFSQPLTPPPPNPSTPDSLKATTCSLESLARGPRRNVRTLRACLSAGHVDATPSPTRATALSAKDIDVGSRAGHGASDTANCQIRDRDTRRWRARRGSVLFSPNQQWFLSICVVRWCCLPCNLAG